VPSGLAFTLGATHAVALLVAAAGTLVIYRLRGKPLRPALSIMKHRPRR
jgi:hypothetical protein